MAKLIIREVGIPIRMLFLVIHIYGFTFSHGFRKGKHCSDASGRLIAVIGILDVFGKRLDFPIAYPVCICLNLRITSVILHQIVVRQAFDAPYFRLPRYTDPPEQGLPLALICSFTDTIGPFLKGTHDASVLDAGEDLIEYRRSIPVFSGIAVGGKQPSLIGWNT